MAPSVLVFARTWSLDALDTDIGQGDRAAHASARRRARLAGDVATAATLYQARHQGDAVFVIQEREVVRVGCDAHDLVSALDAATACLAERRTRAPHEAGHAAAEMWSPAQPLIDPRSRP